jgi:hypothetical protein
MKPLVVLFVTVALSGCASHGNVVRCDGRLKPINMPVPRTAQVVTPVGSSESDAARPDRE